MAESNFATLTVTVTTAGTPVQISSTDIWVKSFEVWIRDTNTSVNMYVGSSSVANSGTWMPRLRSAIYSFSVDSDRGLPAADGLFNLKNIYMDATSSGDVALVQYTTHTV